MTDFNHTVFRTKESQDAAIALLQRFGIDANTVSTENLGTKDYVRYAFSCDGHRLFVPNPMGGPAIPVVEIVPWPEHFPADELRALLVDDYAWVEEAAA